MDPTVMMSVYIVGVSKHFVYHVDIMLYIVLMVDTMRIKTELVINVWYCSLPYMVR